MEKKDARPPEFHNYHVTAEQGGLALIAVLRQFLPERSWSEARRLIHNRHIQINGNLCVDEGRRLRADDVVRVWREPRNAPPGRKTSKSATSTPIW